MIDIYSAILKLYPQVASIVDTTAYDANGNQVSYNLQAVTEQAEKNANVAKAKFLLASTDWAVLPDVGLANSAEYVTYRGILRGLVIDPQAEFDFPTEPTPVWE
jgi:hypothetical protein